MTCHFTGYGSDVRLSENFLGMHMRPLTNGQGWVFIHNWYRIAETGPSTNLEQAKIVTLEKAENLLSKLAEHEFRARRVFELTRNTLLPSYLCLMHCDRGNLPRERARLYEECIEGLLGFGMAPSA